VLSDDLRTVAKPFMENELMWMLTENIEKCADRAAKLEAELAVRDRALEIIHNWQGEGKPLYDISYVGQALKQAREELADE